MSSSNSSIFTPIFIGGSTILLISFAIRASFGLFQIPIETEFGWLRSDFSLAIAIQNLCWGIATPFFGAFAEKFGNRKAILIGGLLYAAGLLVSSGAVLPETHQFLNIIIGFGIAGTGFGPILAVFGRTTHPDKRSLALGIGTAAGSAGQVVGPPIISFLLIYFNWSEVFIVLSIIMALSMLLLLMMKTEKAPQVLEKNEYLKDVLIKAFKDPTFSMLFLGFFSCGFQLAFITAHFPAFITEVCAAIPPNSFIRSIGVNSTSSLGAFSIAVIGFFNIIGAIVAGYLGKNFTKKYLLSIIYTGRTIAAIIFIYLPMTVETVIIFSMVMGSLWLATVPLTSGVVAYIYGLQYMGTLYGIIFLSHQLGSFVGVALGGYFYDIYGSYELVWWVGIGVGAFSAIIHLPVKETPIDQRISQQTN